MTRILSLIALCLLCSAGCAHAQTVSYSLAWDQSVSPATVATYSFTLAEDGVSAAVAAPTCTTDAAGTHCASPLPNVFLPLSGTHTFVLKATLGPLSASSAPITYAAPVSPDRPLLLNLVLKVTVP